MAVVQEQRETKSNRGRPPKKVEKLFKKKLSGPYQKPETHALNNRPVKSENNKRRRAAESICQNAKAWASVLERAKEVQANLAPEFPSLVKTMLPSHVTGGFWLGLPKRFCHLHLPKNDVIITLEDENQEVYETKYLAVKVGLSGGWRGFSIAHKLAEGDVLVFHLVTPSKFKVYIFRQKYSDEVDCALGLLKLEAHVDQMDTNTDTAACEREIKGYITSLSYDNPHVEILDQSNSANKGSVAEVFNGIRLSDSVVSFEEVRSLEYFNVLVNGLIIDSEICEYLKAKYYELCCSQKTFLHEHLLEGLNYKLAAGIILETINIADAIKASKITTSKDDFATWDKTLKCFEGLGMKVSFLRARLDQLLNIASKSERYKEAKLERDCTEGEFKNLEAKLLVAKQTMNRLNGKIELAFQEVASAPW